MLLLSITMQTKPLHIISFDNPFPPDFGGAIDVFYKVFNPGEVEGKIQFEERCQIQRATQQTSGEHDVEKQFLTLNNSRCQAF